MYCGYIKESRVNSLSIAHNQQLIKLIELIVCLLWKVCEFNIFRENMFVGFYVQHYTESSEATDVEHFGQGFIRDSVLATNLDLIQAFKDVAKNHEHFLILIGFSIFCGSC